MNVQPLLPSTTPLVIVERKSRPWPDDTGEIIYGKEKVSVLMLHT